MMQRFFRSRPISELDGKTAIVLLLAVLTAACVSREERRPGRTERRGEFYTTEYLSKAEALRAVFPDAARVLRERVVLSPERRREVEKLVETPLRQDAFVVYFGVRDDGELALGVSARDEHPYILDGRPHTEVVEVEKEPALVSAEKIAQVAVPM